jgi:hypothetical protein
VTLDIATLVCPFIVTNQTINCIELQLIIAFELLFWLMLSEKNAPKDALLLMIHDSSKPGQFVFFLMVKRHRL